MKLSNIRDRGRYKNKETDQQVNVKIGCNTQRSTDHLFYLYRGKRIFIPDNEFYGENKKWEKIDQWEKAWKDAKKEEDFDDR